MPIITGRDGKRYKMLVAPLILDLDGRFNLSVHGNRMRPIDTTPDPSVPDDFIHTSARASGRMRSAWSERFGPYSQEARNLVFQRRPGTDMESAASRCRPEGIRVALPGGPVPPEYVAGAVGGLYRGQSARTAQSLHHAADRIHDGRRPSPLPATTPATPRLRITPRSSTRPSGRA